MVVSSRKADACEAATAELNRDHARDGGEAISIPCHAGKLDELEALVSRTLDRWGKITACVPNAAANPYHGGLVDIPDSAFDKIMETNVRATFWLCRLVLPHMVERGGRVDRHHREHRGAQGEPRPRGVRDVQGRGAPARPQPRGGVRPARHPDQRNRPGLIRTDFAKALWTDPERLEAVSNRLPLRRIGDPVEVAGAALFLASPAASYVTGQVLNVCGGAAVV